MRISKLLTLCALAATAAAPAFAVGDSMPAGTHEITAGLMLIDTPRAPGGRERIGVLLPVVTGSFLGGALQLSPGRASYDLSGSPNLEYGPIVSMGVASNRIDEIGKQSRVVLEGGAFAAWRFDHSLKFGSELLYGSGARRNGLQLDLRADIELYEASHLRIGVAPGLSFVNAGHMRSTFGLDTAQAARDGLPEYHPSGGLESVSVDILANWEMSQRWNAGADLKLSRLAGPAAHSPLIERRDGVTPMVFVTRHW